MNPILQMLKPQHPQNNIMAMAQNIKNGSAEPRTEVMRILKGMTMQDKHKLKAALPAFKAFAKRQGMADNNINAFMLELENNLA